MSASGEFLEAWNSIRGNTYKLPDELYNNKWDGQVLTIKLRTAPNTVITQLKIDNTRMWIQLKECEDLPSASYHRSHKLCVELI